MRQLVIYSAVILLLIGCQYLDGDNKPYRKVVPVQIENTTMADTVRVNETASIFVQVSAINGCFSDLFVELHKEEAYVCSIKAYGTFTCYEGGCVCTDNLVEQDTVLDFQPLQSGTYVFRILKSSNVLVMDTLVVVE